MRPGVSGANVSSQCGRLSPVVEHNQIPISIVKVDCVGTASCARITKSWRSRLLRIFKEAEPQSPDYREDRTVEAFTSFVENKLAQDEQVRNMDERLVTRTKRC